MLGACGSDDGGDAGAEASDPTSDPTTPQTSAPSSEPSSVAPRDNQKSLVAADEVPVGGGVILAGRQVVVTQPAEGEFKAFSAICTHAQCVVSSVDTSIMCECHGSSYALDDGSVLGGPAPSPLPAVDVAVRDGQVVRG